MLTGAFHKLSFPVAPLDTACMQSLTWHMPGSIDSDAKRVAPIGPSNPSTAYDRRLDLQQTQPSIWTKGGKDASLSKLIGYRNLPFQSFDNIFPDAALHFLTFSAGHDRAQSIQPPPRQLLDKTALGYGARAHGIADSEDLRLKAIMSPKPPVPLLPNRARADQ